MSDRETDKRILRVAAALYHAAKDAAGDKKTIRLDIELNEARNPLAAHFAQLAREALETPQTPPYARAFRFKVFNADASELIFEIAAPVLEKNGPFYGLSHDDLTLLRQVRERSRALVDMAYKHYSNPANDGADDKGGA